MTFRLNKNSGFTLVEVLVALGIMAITIAGILTLHTSQMQTIKGLSEKLSALSLERTLNTSLADGKVCQFLFTEPGVVGLNPASAEFDSSSLPQKSAFSLQMIPPLASASAGAAARVGELASPTSNSLRVSALSISILADGGNNQFSGEVVVAFNSPPQITMDLRPLVFPVQLQTTGTGAVKKITGCQLSSGAGTPNYITKWQSSVTMGSSSIYEVPSGDRVGFGTTTPQQTVDINGGLRVAGEIRGHFSCRMVIDHGGPPNYISSARCNSDEFLLNGGGSCEVPGAVGYCASISRGIMHYNAPTADLRGWETDCFHDSFSGESCSEARATCCKTESSP